jgi:hypothetical protein
MPGSGLTEGTNTGYSVAQHCNICMLVQEADHV